MGTLSFSKILKYGCLAAFGLAAAITAIAALSTPASAQSPSEENGDTLKSWDTDNLAYGRFSAKNHRAPFHDYSGNKVTVDAIPCEAYTAAYDRAYSRAGSYMGGEGFALSVAKSLG